MQGVYDINWHELRILKECWKFYQQGTEKWPVSDKRYGKGCEEIRLGICYRPPDGNETQIKGLIKNLSNLIL